MGKKKKKTNKNASGTKPVSSYGVYEQTIYLEIKNWSQISIKAQIHETSTHTHTSIYIHTRALHSLCRYVHMQIGNKCCFKVSFLPLSLLSTHKFYTHKHRKKKQQKTNNQTCTKAPP